MRIVFALPVLALVACSVDNDPANDQVTLEYNEERIEDTASDAANAAESAGAAIENEIGDLDVDVDVNRNRSGNSQ